MDLVEPQTRRRAGRWREWALLACSLGFTLALGEGAARMVLPRPLPWLYPQLRYRADPALVFVLAPDQTAFTADKSVRINSRGLRGEEIPYARRPGLLRLLWLGDSIVFGFGVVDEQVVTRRVEDLMERGGVRTETLNAGVPGYNTEQEVDFMAREGVRYRPDWVIVGFCWNDINDQWGARVCPNGWLVPKTAGEAACDSSFVESPRAYEIRNVLKRSRIAYGVMEGLRAVSGHISPDDHTVFRSEVLEGRATQRVRVGWARVEAALQRLAAVGEKTGFRTLIVAFPLPLALERAFPNSDYPARLADIAKRGDMPFLDLQPAFRSAFDGHESLFIPYDGDHPNAGGHDVAAREIAAFLQAQGR